MSVVIETTLGDITVDLYLQQRPRSCLNFLKLCKLKYYNYNLFHTVSRGFITQTGDPTGSRTGGSSVFGVLEGPAKRYMEAEANPRIKHTKAGLISFVCNDDFMMASQFFFTLADELTYLDEKHCVFGEVVEGHDVLDQINDAICCGEERPYQDIRITHTVVLDDPLPDPSDLGAPPPSPPPTADRLQGGRIPADEDVDDTTGKTTKEVSEMMAEREAKARATILEMVGDIPDAEMAPPENVLFVCKLNPVTTDDDLEIIFSRFGKIKSCEVIRDHKSGDSLQYAFIEFDDKKACEDAFFKMDNVLIDDRRIHVDFSQSVSKMKWNGKGRGVTHFDGQGNKIGKSKQEGRQENGERYKDRSGKNSGDAFAESKQNRRGESSSPGRRRRGSSLDRKKDTSKLVVDKRNKNKQNERKPQDHREKSDRRRDKYPSHSPNRISRYNSDRHEMRKENQSISTHSQREKSDSGNKRERSTSRSPRNREPPKKRDEYRSSKESTKRDSKLERKIDSDEKIFRSEDKYRKYVRKESRSPDSRKYSKANKDSKYQNSSKYQNERSDNRNKLSSKSKSESRRYKEYNRDESYKEDASSKRRERSSSYHKQPVEEKQREKKKDKKSAQHSLERESEYKKVKSNHSKTKTDVRLHKNKHSRKQDVESNRKVPKKKNRNDTSSESEEDTSEDESDSSDSSDSEKYKKHKESSSKKKLKKRHESSDSSSDTSDSDDEPPKKGEDKRNRKRKHDDDKELGVRKRKTSSDSDSTSSGSSDSGSESDSDRDRKYKKSSKIVSKVTKSKKKKYKT